MPKFSANKDEIGGFPPLPSGMYDVRLDGFSPEKSKNGDSVNLRPRLIIVNSAQFNDRQVFDNLNTRAKFMWPDFCHAFGVPLEESPDGQLGFPGDFIGPDDDPSKWNYVGPLLGQVGKVYVDQVEYNGKTRNRIRFYVCRLVGCNDFHKAK